MRKKTLMLVLLSLSVFSIILPTVLAQEGIFGAILGPLGDFAEAYDDYYPVVDTIAYLIVFIGLAEWALGKRFKDKGGRTVTFGLALVFAVSAGLWGATSKFKLASMGPIAVGLFLALMCLAVYEGLRKHEIRRMPALAFAYTIFGVGIVGMGLFPVLGERWRATAGIMSAVWLFAIGYLIYSFFRGRKAGASAEDRLSRPFDEGAKGRVESAREGYKAKEDRAKKEEGIVKEAEAMAQIEGQLARKDLEFLEGALIVIKQITEKMEPYDGQDVDVDRLLGNDINDLDKKSIAASRAADRISRQAKQLANKIEEKMEPIGDAEVKRDAEDLKGKITELDALEQAAWRGALRDIHAKLSSKEWDFIIADANKAITDLNASIEKVEEVITETNKLMKRLQEIFAAEKRAVLEAEAAEATGKA